VSMRVASPRALGMALHVSEHSCTQLHRILANGFPKWQL
jgi:hypothetical protein